VNEFSIVNGDFTMLHTLLMLTIDIILFSIITWYFDAVLPGDFGTSQPLHFPFTVFVSIFHGPVVGEVHSICFCF